MSRLSIRHKNVTFINPFLLASSPVTRNAEMILRAFKTGWAGAVTKTICFNHETMKNVSPRLYGVKSNSGLTGLENIELISDRPVDAWLNDIKLIKDSYPDRVLIASIMAEGYKLEDWQKLTELTQNAGADIIELNLSCPHGLPERGMGSYFSEAPNVSSEIVKGVKKVANVPVWAKLSPNITDIAKLAQLCVDSGVDGVVAINTVKGFAGINVESVTPNLVVDGKSAYGGFSGQMVKPIAMKAVSEIADKTDCFISASGGISNWEDAVEFMLLGAHTLQICTEVMFNGYEIIYNLLNGLDDYLSRHKYTSASDLIGLALKNITSFEDLNKNTRAVAKIYYEECNDCGKCYISCRDGGYQAVELYNEGYVINQERCECCGLCQIVCPLNCIRACLVKNIKIKQ
jgi:dihydropyrimidine dehydrogenase (NAD+) subunit PreA